MPIPIVREGLAAAVVSRFEEATQERQVRLTAQRVPAHHLNPGLDQDNPVDTFWRGMHLGLTDAVLIDWSLIGTRFDGRADFYRAAFAVGAWFRRARFTLVANFGAVRFDGAWFGEAEFLDGASFDEARFDGGASFDRARFAPDLGFNRFTRRSFFRRSGSAEVETGRPCWVRTDPPDERPRSWPSGWAPTPTSERHPDEPGGAWARLVRDGDRSDLTAADE